MHLQCFLQYSYSEGLLRLRKVRPKQSFDSISEMSGKPSRDSSAGEDDKGSNSKQSEVKHRRGGVAVGKQRYKKGKS